MVGKKKRRVRRRKADKKNEKARERERKRRKERDETREPKTGGLHTRAQRGRACTRGLNFNFHSAKSTLRILARFSFAFARCMIAGYIVKIQFTLAKGRRENAMARATPWRARALDRPRRDQSAWSVTHRLPARYAINERAHAFLSGDRQAVLLSLSR